MYILNVTIGNESFCNNSLFCYPEEQELNVISMLSSKEKNLLYHMKICENYQIYLTVKI